MAELAEYGGTEGVLEREPGRTWYRVVGELGTGRPPVVVCHGGPGMTHDYLLPIAELAATGRAFVFYDQFGAGRSDHRRDAPAGFWTTELFVAELLALVDRLGLSGGFHLLGHSWGGMLALEAALLRPAGLRSLVLADTFASSATYTHGVAGLLRELPADVRTAIERHEAGEEVDAAEYREAVTAFYRRHVCRAAPLPEGLRRTMAAMAEDPTVYQAMMGTSEFSMTGSLKAWDVSDRLDRITLPCLVLSGRYDEVARPAVEELYRGLPLARRREFGSSSHMPHLEEPEAFRSAVEVFLDGVEATPSA